MDLWNESEWIYLFVITDNTVKPKPAEKNIKVLIQTYFPKKTCRKHVPLSAAVVITHYLIMLVVAQIHTSKLNI